VAMGERRRGGGVYCYAVVTLLLHCCHTVVILLSRCITRVVHCCHTVGLDGDKEFDSGAGAFGRGGPGTTSMNFGTKCNCQTFF
jgi:hypothetical protein